MHCVWYISRILGERERTYENVKRYIGKGKKEKRKKKNCPVGSYK
jgi:hypothetical protein